MAMKTFAAIVIGSTETEMRVYEFTSRREMKEIDCISTRINLGIDAYSEGSLDPAKVQDLCVVLKEFKAMMEGYKVDAYRVVATSAFREIRSSMITRDYIEKQTGLKIDVISNSEQRFLDYKSIASESDSFEKIIQSGAAIVDIGGSSMQISVFDNDKLITTQNIRMGKVSSREKYLPKAKNNHHFEMILKELMEHELAGFSKLYQKDRQIRNLIVVDADLLDLVKRMHDGTSGSAALRSSEARHVTAEEFVTTYDMIMNMNPDDIIAKFDISSDSAHLIPQSLIFCRCMLEKMGAQALWLMDVSVCDGMAYDFGLDSKLIKARHNFDEDIIAASRNIAKRYKSNQAHIRNTEENALGIFDSLKKIHGLRRRERLLLQIAAILHNCGKYISLTNVSDCAYNIIMATEIIGLSHEERLIVANVVKYNTADFKYYSQGYDSDVSEENYIVIAKLTALLRAANALDRSHKQKCKECSVTIKGSELIISVTSQEDLTLEKTTLEERAEFFGEVFNVHPVLHQKKKR